MDDREKAERLGAALSQFQAATRLLEDVWEAVADHGGDALENYPSTWPSFDELAAGAAGLRVRPGYRFSEGRAVDPDYPDGVYAQEGYAGE